MTLSPEFTSRSTIETVSNEGLVLQINGIKRWTVWSSVTSVAATRAPANAGWIFVMALEIAIDGDARLFAIGEFDLIWVPLTSILHQVIPDIEPFECWGPRAMKANQPLSLYDRDDSDH